MAKTGTNSASGKRLGTRLRGQLADAYSARGRLTSKLIYTYSPRMRRDVVLKSELEYWHFVLCESDSRISSTDYAPKKEIVEVGDDVHGTIVDTVVWLKDGTVEWREIKYSDDSSVRGRHQKEAQAAAAHKAGVAYLRLSEREIFEFPQRISNWVEVIAWLSAVRNIPTLEYDLAVRKLIKSQRLVTVEDVQALANSRPQSSCFVASAFSMLQKGEVFSDLDIRPLTSKTIISSMPIEV